MLQFLLLIPILFSSALAVSPDVNASKFEIREKKNRRVDTFDFKEVYPNLENIDIDAKKKKCVELTMTGEFPVLETVSYEGQFGELKGTLTGKFPKLKQIDLACTSCAMELDCKGEWAQSCTLNIRNVKENIILKLPKEVGIILQTKVGLKGRVIAGSEFKKQGKFGILNKTYKNELADTAEVVLTINLETIDGTILIE